MRSANIIENAMSDNIGEVDPSNEPIAIPLKAPCPSESEKNAILLDTTIVDNKPNKGVINNTAIKPLIIN